MASRETMGTNVEPGLVQRIASGIKYAVTGVTPANWFGPMQPLAPVAQDQTEGRRFDYPVATNLRFSPRSEENVSFGQLRALADAYDLMRLILETRKDQVEAYEWEIVPADPAVNPNSMKAQILAVSQFLESPDQENSWPQWLRMQIEDLLVLDAVCIYPRMNRGGTLYGLELVAPDTIKRIIDDGGRTPLPPDVAYQQVLKGIPVADYSRDTLIYTMRNPRTNRIYGLGPVEQVITSVNIALRRQMSQLEFYTSGNVPEALAQVPDTWTPKQIAEFQLLWDSMNEGNTAQRRKMRFIPKLDNIVFPKEGVLKDEFDEWLARIVCFCFSISPSAFVKQVNRASGEQMQETAKEEGLLPLMRFLELHMTKLIARFVPQGQGLKFKWKYANKISLDVQAKIDGSDVENQIRSPDECRVARGMEPMTPEARLKAFPPPPAPLPPTPGIDAPPPIANPAAMGKSYFPRARK